MKLTALSIALIAAIGVTTGCSTQSTISQASRPAASINDAEAQYALGRYYQGQQRYELAIEAYRRALVAYPGHVSAHNGLGASLLLAGRNAEAIEQFKAGLMHQPRSAALWNNLGYAYTLSGQSKLAEMALKQSLDLDPTDYKTNTNLAMAQQAVAETAPTPTVVVQTTAQVQPVQNPAVEIKSVPVYPVQPGVSIAEPVKVAPAPVVTAAASSPVLAPAQPSTAPINVANPAQAAVSSSAPEHATPVPVAAKAAIAAQSTVQADATPMINVAPAAVAKPTASTIVAEPAVKLQPSIELTQAAVAPATVQIAEIAPRVYELNLPETAAASPTTSTASAPAPVVGAARISIPLRDAMVQTASLNSDDFVLEIRNGNGVHRMAWRTSQYLAGQGYTTKRLTNQPGFNVKVTRIFYLPGYLAEATRLLAHMPKDTVLTETSNLRRGTHVRVVLGRDMAQHQANLDAAPPKIQLAAL